MGIKTKVKIIFLLLQLLITSIIIKIIHFCFIIIYAHDVGIPRHLNGTFITNGMSWMSLLNQVPTCTN